MIIESEKNTAQLIRNRGYQIDITVIKLQSKLQGKKSGITSSSNRYLDCHYFGGFIVAPQLSS